MHSLSCFAAFLLQPLSHKVLSMQTESYLQEISEIRSLMERSNRFLSLSGLSGVMAGLYALAGAGIAWYLGYDAGGMLSAAHDPELIPWLVLDGALVLMLALTTVIWLTWRRSRRTGQTIWDPTARRLLINLMIPLVSGGLLCLIFILRGDAGMIAPLTLIFYGIALVNGSKYTLHDIRTLGLLEIALGLLAACWVGYGLLFWAIGFGLLHIVYGIYMHRKYEKGE
jgi:hypothetical protein